VNEVLGEIYFRPDRGWRRPHRQNLIDHQDLGLHVDGRSVRDGAGAGLPQRDGPAIFGRESTS